MPTSPEERLLAASYRAFGKAAIYTAPDGSSAPCTVVIVRAGRPTAVTPYETLDFGSSGVDLAVSQLALLVRTSEIAEPESGGRFELEEGGKVYAVGDAPIPYDAEGYEWACKVSTDDPA